MELHVTSPSAGAWRPARAGLSPRGRTADFRCPEMCAGELAVVSAPGKSDTELRVIELPFSPASQSSLDPVQAAEGICHKLLQVIKVCSLGAEFREKPQNPKVSLLYFFLIYTYNLLFRLLAKEIRF